MSNNQYRPYPQPEPFKPGKEHDQKQAKIQRVRRELDSVGKRIDELHTHLNNRPYPFLQWNIQDSITILSEKHTALSNELNKLAENPNYGYE